MSRTDDPNPDTPRPSMGEDFMGWVGSLVRERHELSGANYPAATPARPRKWPLRAERHAHRDERTERGT